MRGGGEGAVLMMNAVVGLLTGIIASMGLGGGFVLLIWLTMFQDMPQRAAQGINLLFFLPIALVSVVMHARAGLIDKRLVWSLIPGGILGAVLGLSAPGGGRTASEVVRAFPLAFGLREIFRKAPSDTKKEPRS